MRPLLLVLLGICCLATSMVEGVGSEVPEKSICVSLTTQPLPVNRIRTYTIKEGPMKAVIFVTRRGLKICADPKANWVTAAINTVDGRFNTRRRTAQTKPTATQQTTKTAVTMTA